MKEIKFNYFYRIENKINGNFYYGVHRTNNLDDGYMGSGKRLRYAINKYGIENFNKEILMFFEEYDEALNYEEEVVNEVLLIDPSCYNLTKGGKGGWYYINNVKYKDGHIFNKNKVVVIIDGKFKKVSKEEYLNNNLILQHNNHTCFKDDAGKIFYLNNDDKKIKELNLHGVNYNKILCKDKNGNTYMVDINDIRYLSGEFECFWKNRNHSLKTKEKMKKTMNEHEHQQGEKNSQYGTCWITNEKENKKIYKGDLIPDGWKLGRKIK